MARPFLTAHWTNLCIISYEAPRGLLEPYLPRGLELDVRPETAPGMGLVSLVAFDFTRTRVLGVPWPGHVAFPEINLRFYARLPVSPGVAPDAQAAHSRRGVVFIRELVPRRAISFIARTLYSEPYVTMPMRSSARREQDRIVLEHQVVGPGGRPMHIRASADATSVTPPAESMEHWFKEHQWGFGRNRAGETVMYQVEHPVWEVYSSVEHSLDFDWANTYGAEWSFLADAKPCSVVLAVGSPVRVYPKRILKGP